MEPKLRPTARVLLLDDADRLLLFRSVNESGRAFWFPPGGGIEPGEDAPAAARREVAEETGLAGLELVAEVWRRRHVFDWHGVTYDLRERWFLARVPAFEIDTAGFEPVERDEITGHRWWTLPELHAATDDLVPRDLAQRLETLLTAGPPATPIEVGV
ncbi:MAG TPA: NUDIX domain-containing protein [Streptosporangiaceae bacterium]|jgi:8-oxo-dGTP pyrophosphatase MutT (NUDIX family)